MTTSRQTRRKKASARSVCYMRAERRKWWHSALVWILSLWNILQVQICRRGHFNERRVTTLGTFCPLCARGISNDWLSHYSTGSQHFRFMLIGFCAKFHRLLHNFIVISRTNTGSRSFVCFSRSDSKHCGLTMDCSHKFVPLGCLSNNARAAVTPQTLESAKSANHSLTLWFGIVFVRTQKKVSHHLATDFLSRRRRLFLLLIYY